MFSWRFLIFLVYVTWVYGFYKNYGFKPRVDTCRRQGFQCSEDCTSILACSGQGAIPVLSVNCSLNPGNDKTCFSDGSNIPFCSDNATGCTLGAGGGFPFQCTGPGNFPDPFNCENSYTCGAGSNTNSTGECTCPSGSVWINNTADCSNDKDEVQACCIDGPVFVSCEKNKVAGGFSAGCPWKESGYYYVCIRASGNTTISVQKCADGQVFDDGTGKCEIVSGSAKFSHSWKMREEIDVTGISPRTLPVCTSAPPPVNCTRPGQIIPVQGKCRMYWVCDDNLQPILRECDPGTKLDCSNPDKCVCVVCINCCSGD